MASRPAGFCTPGRFKLTSESMAVLRVASPFSHHYETDFSLDIFLWNFKRLLVLPMFQFPFLLPLMRWFAFIYKKFQAKTLISLFKSILILCKTIRCIIFPSLCWLFLFLVSCSFASVVTLNAAIGATFSRMLLSNNPTVLKLFSLTTKNICQNLFGATYHQC